VRKQLQHPPDSGGGGGRRFDVCAGEQCYFTLRSLLILCPSYLLFMVANGGLALPGGLFMPSIMVRPASRLRPVHGAVFHNLGSPNALEKRGAGALRSQCPQHCCGSGAGLSHSR